MDEATFMGSNSQHTPWPSTYVTGGEMRACKGVRRDAHMHSSDIPGLQFIDSRQELRVIAGRRMSALRRANSIASRAAVIYARCSIYPVGSFRGPLRAVKRYGGSNSEHHLNVDSVRRFRRRRRETVRERGPQKSDYRE